MRRSSKSVSGTFVEGYGRRRYKNEFERYITFSIASCDETREWLEYIRDCYPELAAEGETYLKEVNEIGRMLAAFLHAVETGHRSPK